MKKKILKYGIPILFFIILAVLVSIAGIMIKYRLVENEIASTEPYSRQFCTYYNSLTYREQLLYDTVITTAQKFEKESQVIPTLYSMEEFEKILSYVRADNPELFYISYDELVLHRSDLTNKTKVGMVYIDTKENVDSMKQQYEAAVTDALKVVDQGMTDFEKEVAINDHITRICSESMALDDRMAGTAYGALVQKTALCDGYAYAAKELLNRVGIDACIVYGEANGVKHVWNMVKIDSIFYHLDVLWNDADFTEVERPFHGYFNLSDTKIGIDHSYKNAKGILPSASVENCYYRKIGCYAADPAELETVLYNSLKNAVNNNLIYIEFESPVIDGNESLRPYFSAAVQKINAEAGTELLMEAFSLSEASETAKAYTIQIFYK